MITNSLPSRQHPTSPLCHLADSPRQPEDANGRQQPCLMYVFNSVMPTDFRYRVLTRNKCRRGRRKPDQTRARISRDVIADLRQQGCNDAAQHMPSTVPSNSSMYANLLGNNQRRPDRTPSLRGPACHSRYARDVHRCSPSSRERTCKCILLVPYCLRLNLLARLLNQPATHTLLRCRCFHSRVERVFQTCKAAVVSFPLRAVAPAIRAVRMFALPYGFSRCASYRAVVGRLAVGIL